MTILQDLPVELLQGIFAFTQTDGQPATLIACSAVSWLWRDIALPQLFSSFNTRRTESFTDVLHFLSTHPHIAACVKHLSLGSAAGSLRTLSDLGKPRPHPALDHETARALLQSLPALRELSFHRVKFVGPRVAEPLPPSVSHSPSPAASSPVTPNTDALGEDRVRPYRLQWVALDRHVFGYDPTPLFRILSLCDIDTLQLACPRFPDEEGLQPERLPVRGTLRARRLRIGLHSRWGLTRALQGHLEPACLRELSIGCDNRESLESAGALLRDVGRNLTLLKLRLSWGMSAVKNTSRKWCAALNLSACTALETFYLLPYGLVMDRTGMSPGGMCADMVSSLAPSVRTIILRLYADGVESKGEESFGLGNLDEVVMKNKQKRLRELETVTLQFSLCKEGQFEGWSSTSRKAMPRLEGAGILRVTRDG